MARGPPRCPLPPTLFEKGYREIVSLPSALAAYRTFFVDIASDAHFSALFHTARPAKDRTGWALCGDYCFSECLKMTSPTTTS